MRLIPDRGHVYYRPWDMPSTFFEPVAGCEEEGLDSACDELIWITYSHARNLIFFNKFFFTFHKSEQYHPCY